MRTGRQHRATIAVLRDARERLAVESRYIRATTASLEIGTERLGGLDRERARSTWHVESALLIDIDTCPRETKTTGDNLSLRR